MRRHHRSHRKTSRSIPPVAIESQPPQPQRYNTKEDGSLAGIFVFVADVYDVRKAIRPDFLERLGVSPRRAAVALEEGLRLVLDL